MSTGEIIVLVISVLGIFSVYLLIKAKDEDKWMAKDVKPYVRIGVVCSSEKEFYKWCQNIAGFKRSNINYAHATYEVGDDIYYAVYMEGMDHEVPFTHLVKLQDAPEELYQVIKRERLG